eukprot:scaffold94709_cov21-Tisochrysis_lutea.AAC.4
MPGELLRRPNEIGPMLSMGVPLSFSFSPRSAPLAAPPSKLASPLSLSPRSDVKRARSSSLKRPDLGGVRAWRLPDLGGVLSLGLRRGKGERGR